MKWPARLALALVLAAGSARAGETRCWFDGGALVVPAAFGDIAGDFIVDLSAPRSTLHDTAARAAGWVGGSARADLRIAGERLGGFEIGVADLDARIRAFPTNIAGVLGADALAPFVADIDFARCRLGLSRRAPAAPRGGVRLPVRRVAGVPSVRAAVSDGPSSRWGVFAIATAGPEVGLAEARFSRLPRPGALARGRLRALSLGGQLFEQLAVTPGMASPAGLDGYVGTDVWSCLRLRLDPRRAVLTLWASGDPPAPQCPTPRQTVR